MTLEMKLEMAAEEINRLKAEKANRENASQVEHTPPKLKISVPEYESAPVASKSEKIALSPSGISKRETWKKYVGVLKEQNCILKLTQAHQIRMLNGPPVNIIIQLGRCRVKRSCSL